MNKFKRVMASLATAVMVAVGGIGAVTVSADYDNCDVNRDGYVDSADYVMINKYLNGIYSTPNYNQLDVNRSLTVDAADSQCLISRLMGSSYSAYYLSRERKIGFADDGLEIPFPNVSGFTPDSYVNSSTQGCQYRRYSYAEQEELTPYTLIPDVWELNTSVNSRGGVIGADERYLAYGEENSGIVYLNMGIVDSNGKNVNGTGFIVGDHQIATAAHCLYNRNENEWYNITISTYNNDGSISNITLTPVEAHVPDSYVSHNWGYNDYALITVEEDLSDLNCVYFSLGSSYNITSSNYANVPLYTTGCPQYVNDYLYYNENNHLYSAEGRVIRMEDSALFYSFDASGGNSGGPIYTITKNIVGSNIYYTYTALAIHHGGMDDAYNMGSLITNYHLQFYHNNPNAGYTLN